MAALFNRIIPILFVSDLQAERDFYVRLGFHVTYEGPEYPYFLALGHGSVEFGIEWREGFSSSGPDKVLTWQFGICDIQQAKERLAGAGVRYREELMTPSADWQYRVLHARTPNGYHLLLEEGSD
jgi:catechol 2,3-dioxygenase-like lactoylglutathione lyase family enzyme